MQKTERRQDRDREAEVTQAVEKMIQELGLGKFLRAVSNACFRLEVQNRDWAKK